MNWILHLDCAIIQWNIIMNYFQLIRFLLFEKELDSRLSIVEYSSDDLRLLHLRKYFIDEFSFLRNVFEDLSLHRFETRFQLDRMFHYIDDFYVNHLHDKTISSSIQQSFCFLSLLECLRCRFYDYIKDIELFMYHRLILVAQLSLLRSFLRRKVNKFSEFVWFWTFLDDIWLFQYWHDVIVNFWVDILLVS
jgi:hypothetical protein